MNQQCRRRGPLDYWTLGMCVLQSPHPIFVKQKNQATACSGTGARRSCCGRNLSPLPPNVHQLSYQCQRFGSCLARGPVYSPPSHLSITECRAGTGDSMKCQIYTCHAPTRPLLALQSRALHEMKQWYRLNASTQKEGREMSALTMIQLIHALHVRLGYAIACSTKPKPNNGRPGPHFNFPIWQGERSEVQTWSCPQVQALTQPKVTGGRVDQSCHGPG